MADDSKGPKDDAAKAQALMHQLSGVLNNPVMRSLMGSGTFGTKGELEKSKPPALGGSQPQTTSKLPAVGSKPSNAAMPGMAPLRPLPPIQPLPGMTPAAGPMLVSQIPREQLAAMLDQLQTIVSELDQLMKVLSHVRGGNPALKKQIRGAVTQIVSHLPALIAQIHAQVGATSTPEAQKLPGLIEQIHKQLTTVEAGLDDSPRK